MNSKILRYSNGIFVSTRHSTLETTLTDLDLQHLPRIQMHQTHSTNVAVIDTPVAQEVTWLDDTDAVITNQSATLLVKTADCLPVIITHPRGWRAGIHAGRRGTDQGITQKTLELIVNLSGSQDQYSVWLGPRICKKCYQIDPVLDVYYDLVAENLRQLHTVLPATAFTVDDCQYCTACATDLFYSYRKESTTERIYSGVRP